MEVGSIETMPAGVAVNEYVGDGVLVQVPENVADKLEAAVTSPCAATLTKNIPTTNTARRAQSIIPPDKGEMLGSRGPAALGK